MTEDSTSQADLEAVARRIGRVVAATRAARGMSLGELGRASGLSKTILARIERGDGNPSVETLFRVSQALRLPLGSLLAEDTAPRVRVVRAGEGEALSSDAGMTAWLLHADGRPRRGDLYELDLPAGVDQRTPAHLPGTEEVVVCVSGELVVGPLGDEVTLRPGDAAAFVADAPHRYEAREACRALCWMRYGGDPA